MYLGSAGRCTTQGVATSLGLSVAFMEQVARKLRMAKVVTVKRGPNGGYELSPNATVKDVLDALSPVSLLSSEEALEYAQGTSEYRSLANLVLSLNKSMSALLRKRIKEVKQDLVSKELLTMNSVTEEASV